MKDIDLTQPEVLGGCVYYGQNREDLVLLSFFPDVKKGFYVDVGAFDPDQDSVTKLFYKNGWRGINIEPQVERYKRFQQIRKRDINLNVGIAQQEGSLTLRTYTSQGLSTFSDDVKKEYETQPDIDTKEFREVVVPVKRLDAILAEQDTEHVHFLKVDVEGLEYEVLASNDWKRFRPEVICVEANHITKDWHPILEKAGYDLVFDDGLNEYFADKKTKRKQQFNFVKDVINDRGGGVRADLFDLMVQWRNLAKEKIHHVDELAEENARLVKNIAQLESQLNSLRFITRQTTKLLQRNLGKIIHKS